MWTLHKVGQLVELLAGIVGTAGNADAADVLGLVEHGERAGALQHIHQLDELHAEAQVGLVAAETAHSLVPRHTLQGGNLHATNLLEQMAGQVLEDLEHVFLLYERHLAVYLRELRLTVGTQVFIAEALGYLEVTVETADHEQLLQRLW